MISNPTARTSAEPQEPQPKSTELSLTGVPIEEVRRAAAEMRAEALRREFERNPLPAK